MMSLRAQRGQTFPVWAFGTLTVLMLVFFALDYANAIRWQMRAQNAADAAAQGALSIQATEWNKTIMLLHASAIEEFRIRRILDGLLLAGNGMGGCTNPQSVNASGATDCETVYLHLKSAYSAAVARYTTDVALMQRLNVLDQTAQYNEMKSVVTQFQQNCGTNKGGDCAFAYTVVQPQARQNSLLENVEADAVTLLAGGGTQGQPKADMTPAEIEVVTCATVQPLIPNFFRLAAQPFTAIGRAAATSIQVTQEWMDPGHFTNPAPFGDGNLFQPTEFPESTTNQALFGTANYDWYAVEYGGNPAQAFPKNEEFVETINNDEFSEWLGWWSSIPIRPYAGTLVKGQNFQCN